MLNLVGLVLGCLIAVLAYREAKKAVETHGKGPWGLAPGVWAVLGFFLGLIGLLLLVIAKRSLEKEAPKALDAPPAPPAPGAPSAPASPGTPAVPRQRNFVL